jgi:hypothetical protein
MKIWANSKQADQAVTLLKDLRMDSEGWSLTLLF